MPHDAGWARRAETAGARLRIATKYVNSTRRYFAEQGKQVEIIKLYGSMELAPLVKLADQMRRRQRISLPIE